MRPAVASEYGDGGQLLPAAARGHEAQLHGGAALLGDIDPGPGIRVISALPGLVQGEAYAPAARAAGIVQTDMHRAGRMGKTAARCIALRTCAAKAQLQTAQIAMAHNHAGGGAAC